MPRPYVGVWQRQLLEQDGRRDTESQVYWLQTTRWHADLRIPPDRPDFTGVRSLHECDAHQLAWLATQQGFCGITEVDGARCHWRRVVDFQPDSGRRDLGQMAFDGDRLIEVGSEADYLEVWQRQPDGAGGSAVLELGEEVGRPPARRTWLLLVGDWFAYVRARVGNLPAASSFADLSAAQRPSHMQLIDWLDFEISLGRRSGLQPWRIEHSSLPFREGAVLFPAAGLERAGTSSVVERDGNRLWRVLAWDMERF